MKFKQEKHPFLQEIKSIFNRSPKTEEELEYRKKIRQRKKELRLAQRKKRKAKE